MMPVGNALREGRDVARPHERLTSSSISTASPESITTSSSSPACQWRWLEMPPAQHDMAGAEVGEAAAGARRRSGDGHDGGVGLGIAVRLVCSIVSKSSLGTPFLRHRQRSEAIRTDSAQLDASSPCSSQ
jgi:hypothetical protein